MVILKVRLTIFFFLIVAECSDIQSKQVQSQLGTDELQHKCYGKGEAKMSGQIGISSSPPSEIGPQAPKIIGVLKALSF